MKRQNLARHRNSTEADTTNSQGGTKQDTTVTFQEKDRAKAFAGSSYYSGRGSVAVLHKLSFLVQRDCPKVFLVIHYFGTVTDFDASEQTSNAGQTISVVLTTQGFASMGC